MKNLLNKYPYLEENHYVKIANKTMQKKILRKNSRNLGLITDDLLYVLETLDGLKNLNDVCKILSEKFNEPLKEVIKQIFNLLDNFPYIKFLDEPSEHKTKILYENKNDYPSHLDIEITNHCNHRCLYCFNESLPEKKKFMDVNKFISLIDKMAKNGLETIVISGGEPLTHPDIYKIVKHACDNLVAVKLNTNGYLLTHFIYQFKEFSNLDIQVTLNSSTPEIHEKLSNANIEGLHETVVKNINAATKHGLKILLVMNIVPENVDDIENMCKLANNLMCEEFMIGEIEIAGRANSDLYVNTSSERIQNIYEEMNKKYDMKFLKNIERKEFLDCLVRTNCGIFSEFVGIDCDGNIRLCTFARDYLKANNVFNVNLDEYFKALDELSIADVDEPGKEYCYGCRYIEECSHCIYQGLLMRDMIGRECEWGKSKMVTDLVDGLKSLQIKEA